MQRPLEGQPLSAQQMLPGIDAVPHATEDPLLPIEQLHPPDSI